VVTFSCKPIGRKSFSARNKGVALITVMLVVALAAIIATQMLARLQLQVQRTTNINFNQQAYWYAMGAEAFAKRVLFTAFEDEPEKTHLGQLWAQGETSYPVDFGQITGEISDLQACLNLNALKIHNDESDETANETTNETNTRSKKLPAREVLERLIVALNIENVDDFEAEYMADALTDWLDSDGSITSGGGAEDSDYAAKEFPYLPANNFLASVNELRIVEHFTIPVINALKPFVCIIPNSAMHQININTLSAEQPELLHAILDIPISDAEQILADRNAEGFAETSEFFDLPVVSKLKLKDDQKQQFVIDSEYFKLKASTQFNTSFFLLNSIITVDNKNNTTVISRTIGRE